MFHFGLLSSFIPYVVVAILYLFGMTNYAKAILGIPINEKKAELTISQKHTTISSSENASFYSAFQDYIAEHLDTSFEPKNEDILVTYTHNESFKDNPFSSYFFSRPPPNKFA